MEQKENPQKEDKSSKLSRVYECISKHFFILGLILMILDVVFVSFLASSDIVGATPENFALVAFATFVFFISILFMISGKIAESNRRIARFRKR